MFDLGWTELMVIGVVTLIVVGPKDLPKMLRSIGRYTGQLRRMAGEFRRQFDEAMRETELAELRDAVKDVRQELKKIDPRDDLKKVASDTQASVNEIPKSIDKPSSKPADSAAGKSDAPDTPAAGKTGKDESSVSAGSYTGPAAGTSAHDDPAPATDAKPATNGSGAPVDSKRSPVAERAAAAWKKASGDDSGA